MTNIGEITEKTKRKTSEAASYLDVLIFLIPALQFIRLHVIGILSGSDILLLVSFIALSLSGRIKIKERIGRKLLILCSLWLLSQIVTDVVRHTAFVDYARGWSAIGLTLVNFSVMFSLLYGYPRRICIYAWGLVAGGVLATFINPSDLVEQYPWKFGLSLPVTLSVLLIASRRDLRGLWPVVLTGAIGLANFTLGSRNSGEICLGAAFYFVITRILQRRALEGRTYKLRTLIVISLMSVIGLTGTFWAYRRAAASGIMGDDARKKYEEQSNGDYGLLLGGRAELFSSVPAVIDSPILGHGSFSKDPKYLLIEQQALASLGYKAGDVDPEMLEEGLIPTHSHIMGAWVYAGLLGGLFWGWTWLLVCKMLLRSYPSGIKLLPLASYVAFDLLWDILFSPYGAQARILIPFYIVIVINYLGIAQPRSTGAISARVA